MVEMPFSPLACAVVTTMVLAVTFYVGRWIGIKKVMNRIEKEMKEYE